MEDVLHHFGTVLVGSDLVNLCAIFAQADLFLGSAHVRLNHHQFLEECHRAMTAHTVPVEYLQWVRFEVWGFQFIECRSGLGDSGLAVWFIWIINLDPVIVNPWRLCDLLDCAD